MTVLWCSDKEARQVPEWASQMRRESSAAPDTMMGGCKFCGVESCDVGYVAGEDVEKFSFGKG
jgi:hypothetical protein